MRVRLLPSALIALVLGGPAPGLAQTTVTIDPAAGQAYSAQLGIPPELLVPLLTEAIGGAYGLNNPKEFLRLSSNAQTLSHKGIGVDYVSDFENVIFGVGVNLAADAGQATLSEVGEVDFADVDRAIPLGTGAQISLFFGLRVRERLNLYLNGLAYPLRIDAYDGQFYNLGLHGQYQLLTPRGHEVFGRWLGLRLTTGFEYSRTILTLKRAEEVTTDLMAGAPLTLLPTGRLRVTTTSPTIPLEASTGFELFYVLALFLGVGADFQLGSATLDTEMEAAISGAGVPLGTATLQASVPGNPDPVLIRFFAGVQTNLGPVKLFVQASTYVKNLSLSAAGGLRIAI